MHRLILVRMIFILLLLNSGQATAIQPEIESDIESAGLFNEILIKNYQRGKYIESLSLADHVVSTYGGYKSTTEYEKKSIATLLNNAAAVYSILGYYDKSSSLHQRVIAINEKRIEISYLEKAESWNNLATLLFRQRKLEEAKDYFKKALDIKQKFSSTNELTIATSLNNLAVVLESLYEFEDALVNSKQAYNIRKTNLGTYSRATVQSMNNLGMLYLSLSDYSLATTFLKKALDIRKSILPPNYPEIAESLNNLATLYKNQKKYDLAQPLYEEALKLWEKTYGVSNPDTQLTLSNLAKNHLDQGQWESAYKYTYRLTKEYENSISPIEHLGKNTALSVARKHHTQSYRMLLHLQASHDAISQHKSPSSLIIPSALTALQLFHDPRNTQVMTLMALKLASDDPVRKSQVEDFVKSIHLRDRSSVEYIEALVHSKEFTVEKKVLLKTRLEEDQKNVEQSLASLRKGWPSFNELIDPKPLTVDEVQSLLKPHEAILAYVMSNEKSYLMVLRQDRWPSLIELDVPQEKLQKDIFELLEAISLKTIESRGGDNGVHVLTYDIDLSHKLFKQLIAPAVAELQGITHLLTIPNGPLIHLPFAALAAKPHSGRPRSYDEVHWLIRDYSISQLPSITALRMVRGKYIGTEAKEPFLGFGDPVLKGSESGEELAVGKKYSLARLNSLPLAGAELISLAENLAVDKEQRVFIRERATETQFKKLNESGVLKQQRILAFATHALLADQSDGYHGIHTRHESGLVFTPPDKPSYLDDGFLSETEISKLNLNAEWVLLSACNTGRVIDQSSSSEVIKTSFVSEGVSALAKSFFFAGSRNLLVTRWNTVDLSSRELISQLFDKSQFKSKSERLQQAMINMIDNGLKTNECLASGDNINFLRQLHCKIGSVYSGWRGKSNSWAHPVYWAPYVLIGDGK